MKRSTQFLLVCVAISFWWLWPGGRQHTPPQPQPGQMLSNGGFRVAAYSIYPLQDFSIEARVLGREDYRLDRGSDLSPTDLALGWGPMADPQVLSSIRITQGNRWYYWRADSMPIPRREIETHSANMHMIPANDSVARTLAQVGKDDTIRLSGKLVRVEADDGWRWISSLSREDTGAGACELVWVESLERR
ncbi:hypothetical protein NK553_27990 [Pseudomonas sp. ZM23]|uniref:Uncharacterized protein n=1 Tax=Pseudomonas triclosanedens TaxID=2961893 RepID=A0ABY7A3B5_9PSED|nr:hypothetical protein [Pseudomonas triclosanedens]MCP8467797.1 hypothetical protein [Pseudomonas triclosanedens]MCP8473764.1 hypothetical protein [Pseudomonas triclosanedens]MCP8479686.1 hypothetical protein [Pseudomonas triclosanedens]WAI51367.1 hypothetical protein OU419_08995 [Pseudomonas triclosanedens]